MRRSAAVFLCCARGFFSLSQRRRRNIIISNHYRLSLFSVFSFACQCLIIYKRFPRAQYLYWNGAKRFFRWFDHMSWYPLGRPVGTTIYPGMQFTSVFLKNHVVPGMSLNDVCCYVPAWFGVVATLVTGLIAYECTLEPNTHTSLVGFLLDLYNGEKRVPATGKKPFSLSTLATSPAAECGLFAAAMMAIVPAHLMRSVGGGYDNESIAISAMVLTFYFWVRSLRPGAWAAAWGVGTALAYFYMVAAWGGYVFVLNLIGLHAAFLVVVGRFNTQVYLAYSVFYALGTALAVQIPVVGWTPLKSLEQLAPCAVFLGYQLLQYCEILRKKRRLSRKEAWLMRVRVCGMVAAVLVVAVMLLAPKGYFGPISARVRGLFVKHTKTGNPLVDSVAEHQPASSRAYFQYLHHVCTLAPIGFLVVCFNLSDASSFLLVWAVTAYFFSHKMVRLLLLTGPIGSVLGGIAAGRIFAWCVRQWWVDQAAEAAKAASTSGSKADAAKSKAAKAKKGGKKQVASRDKGSSFDGLAHMQEVASSALNTKEGIMFKRSLALVLLLMGYLVASIFTRYCTRLAHDLSNPSIIVKARDSNNEIIKVDDYREAYWWLRDNTPEDARVMAWWDYGYHIAGIANRTTIADGNTWNHEHIALLGKALTTDLDEGYEIARHWADYVLLWAGGRGDDLAKSPHLARIANSVYRDHCPDDPTCRAFGFVDRQMTPSPMMARSFLYRLHSHKLRPGVEVPADKFVEVFKSKYGFVRIYKIIGVSEESKQWVADPKNRLCDAPGSWYCPGQYPPGLSKILSGKKDFQQLEDFNRGNAGDEEYQKRYFEDLADPNKAREKVLSRERSEAVAGGEEAAQETKNVDEIYNTWEDTDDTTRMWKLISSNSYDELKTWLDEKPYKAFVRSRDGRGPMWWAFEQRNEQITNLLMKAGVPHTDKDAKGLTPVDLLEGSQQK